MTATSTRTSRILAADRIRTWCGQPKSAPLKSFIRVLPGIRWKRISTSSRSGRRNTTDNVHDEPTQEASMFLLGLVPGRHFWRGVHVPEHKEQTCHLPIRRLPFAPVLIVPLAQHTGAPAIPIVREGQEVVRGEPIA